MGAKKQRIAELEKRLSDAALELHQAKHREDTALEKSAVAEHAHAELTKRHDALKSETGRILVDSHAEIATLNERIEAMRKRHDEDLSEHVARHAEREELHGKSQAECVLFRGAVEDLRAPLGRHGCKISPDAHPVELVRMAASVLDERTRDLRTTQDKLRDMLAQNEELTRQLSPKGKDSKR